MMLFIFVSQKEIKLMNENKEWQQQDQKPLHEKEQTSAA